MRYGARLTHRWKGRLLTAFAAVGLLAASAGTASAQITAKIAESVTEGDVVTVTVTAEVQYPDSTAVTAGAITMTLTPSAAGSDADNTYEATDISLNPATVSLSYPARAATATGTMDRTLTGTVRVATIDDPDAEDEKVSFTFDSLAGVGSLTDQEGAALAVPTFDDPLTIEDDETQTYVLAITGDDDLSEGEDPTVSLKAVPAHEDNATTLTLNLDRPRPDWSFAIVNAADDSAIAGSVVTIGSTTATPTAGIAEAEITITTPDNDKNRVDDTVTLTAHSGQAGRSTLRDTLTITLKDDHVLPTVAAKVVDEDGMVLDPQTMSVEEGQSIYIAVMPVDKDGMAIAAEEALEVELMPSGSADARDYRLARSTITIADGAKASDPVMLTAEEDQDVGEEILTFNATVTGDTRANGAGSSMSENVLRLTIDDATMKQIWPKDSDADYDRIKAAIAAGADDEGLNPGETVTLQTSDLFGLAEGYTATYGVSVEGSAASASASGDTVTIDAEMAGEAKITVTGTARMASSSLMSSQTVSNVAELTFPVTVVDKALMLTWYVGQGGDDYNIENLVEGQSYEIIVNANRAITEAEGSVEVTFMRDRAASDADDSDYTVGTATISAGRDHAHARPPLMVLADDISEGGTDDGGNVGERLVLFGVASNGAPVMADPEHFSTENGALTIWDTAVPALPVIATWLLGLGLLGGGARQMYLRRRQD